PTGALLAGYPASYTATLSQPVLLTSVQAADLTIDGVPAAGVTVVDPQTLRFDLAGTGHGDGLYTAVIAAGALTSLSGPPLAALSATFDSDVTVPRVIASSIAEGATVPAGGDLVAQIVFSEGLATAGLGGEDVVLVNNVTGQVMGTRPPGLLGEYYLPGTDL